MTELSLWLMVMVWGMNYSVVKSALDHFYPMAFNGIRFAAASAFLFLLLRLGKRKLPKLGRDWPRAFVVGILGNTAYQVLFIFGMKWTLAGNTSLILATTPVFVAIFSYLLGIEKVTRKIWIGILASFTGVTLIIFGSHRVVGLSQATFRGDLTIFFAAMIWSVYIVASTPLVHRYGAMATSACTLWIGAGFLLLFSLPSFLHQNWNAVTLRDWGALLYSALFAISLGQIFWYRAIAERGNARTATYSNLVPLVGLLLAWPLRGEIPTITQMCGASLILSSLFFTGFQATAH